MHILWDISKSGNILLTSAANTVIDFSILLRLAPALSMTVARCCVVWHSSVIRSLQPLLAWVIGKKSIAPYYDYNFMIYSLWDVAELSFWSCNFQIHSMYSCAKHYLWNCSDDFATDHSDEKSTLVQVLTWCRQATSHHLSQCWFRPMSPCRWYPAKNGPTRHAYVWQIRLFWQDTLDMLMLIW